MDSRQSFEQLIKSDQTIQYTLTPENMRNIEVRSPFQSPSLDLTSDTLYRAPYLSFGGP